MPFKSEAQRRFMWAKHPGIAQRWVDEGATSKGLPAHATKKHVAKRRIKRKYDKSRRDGERKNQ